MNYTADVVDPGNNLYFRELRVLIRHLFAYELLVRQLVHIDWVGKPLYFLYLVITEGSVTFFGVFLLALPFKIGVKNENS